MTYGFQIRRSNHSATLLPRQTQGRHKKGRGKGETEINELVVNGIRKTRVLRTLSHSQLIEQSRHDCRRRESMCVANTKNILKQSSHSSFEIVVSFSLSGMPVN